MKQIIVRMQTSSKVWLKPIMIFLTQAYFENGEYYFDVPTDEINTVLENGETLQTLAENSASISVEATVNGK